MAVSQRSAVGYIKLGVIFLYPGHTSCALPDVYGARGANLFRFPERIQIIQRDHVFDGDDVLCGLIQAAQLVLQHQRSIRGGRVGALTIAKFN